MNYRLLPVAAWLSIAVLALPGCDRGAGESATANTAAFKFTTEYQAVHLDNGQVLFGKLEQGGSDYPVLRNAYSAQTQTNPDTKEVRRTLVKRSMDLHNPDYVVLNARHIIAVEPVAATSRVAQVIKQLEAEPTAPAAP
ncbi:MAG: hypothetical protein IPK39_15650 [Sulfuritalea sp.]|nr:hypothetical protein [Sulfuritalea sp.]